MQEEGQPPESEAPLVDPIRAGIRLARFGTIDNDNNEHYYPETIRAAANNIHQVAIALHHCGEDLFKNWHNGGGLIAEWKLTSHADKMIGLCEKIAEKTSNTEEECRETIRDLWKLTRQVPTLVAAAKGKTLEYMAQPKIGDEPNPFLPEFKKLAAARDEIKNEMEFTSHVKVKVVQNRDSQYMIGCMASICVLGLCALAGWMDKGGIQRVNMALFYSISFKMIVSLAFKKETENDKNFCTLKIISLPDEISEFSKLVDKAQRTDQRGIHA